MNIHPHTSLLRKIATRHLRQQPDGEPFNWLSALPHDVRRARGAGAPPARGNAVLTRREIEVLRLVARGWTERDAMERLSLSRRTASNHISNILGKLDVPSRRAAVMTAVRLGMLQAVKRYVQPGSAGSPLGPPGAVILCRQGARALQVADS